MGIQYSMCWEDPFILLKALNISEKDKILSIASGGENVLAMLLKNPKEIVAIDINKEQIYLLKLKLAAIKNLDFNEFVEFLGFLPSDKRIEIYTRIRDELSKEEIEYWNNNLANIKTGVIHSGKFEKYLKIFRRFFLPLIVSKNKILNFLSLDTLDKQEKYFNRYWNNWRFKLLFSIFFSKKGLSYGRSKDYFKHSNQNDLASYYFEKTKNSLTKIPIRDNFFMHYILTGTIKTPFKDHPYLDESNFNKLKELIGKIEIVNEDISNYISQLKDKFFSKYNLSDIFEAKSQEEYEIFLKEIAKISTKNALICYWNNLAPRYGHPKIKGISPDLKFSEGLSKLDRVHFYSRFIVEKINFNK